jgi:mRNA interferase MazF
MATFVKGDVVVLPFPFSDLIEAKRRPAMIIASLERNDYILCMITSQDIGDRYSILIENTDFLAGSLNRTSYVKVNRLFTANERIILYKAGSLNSEKTDVVLGRLIELLQQ